MRVTINSCLWPLRNAVSYYAAMSSESVQQTGPIQRAIEKCVYPELRPSGSDANGLMHECMLRVKVCFAGKFKRRYNRLHFQS